jgi:predicted permease
MDWDDEQVFWPVGQPKPASANDMNWAIDYIIGSDYLRVMQIPLERGRFLTTGDDEHAPVAIVVDDVFARKFYPGRDPIGQRINLQDWGVPAEIVGVVGHVKQWGLDADDIRPLRAQFYLVNLQIADRFMTAGMSGTRVLLRTDGTVPTPQVFDSIRRMSRQMSNEQVVFGAETMNDIISLSFAQRRFAMILLATFAGLALILSTIGIYGVIAYLVAGRTREIGIRMALGADRRAVARLVLRGAVKLALLGVLIGLVSAVALTRLMANMLYGVSPIDPLTYLAISVLLLLVALAASYIPARRAMRVDPVIALRYD